MINEIRIEVNPEKVQVMLAMQSPKSMREVQKLTRCTMAIGRVVFNSGQKMSLIRQAPNVNQSF